MKNFYTNVTQRGNQLLVRSIENGMPQKQKIDFLPTLYTTNKKTANISTDWATLDGIPAYEIHPGDINDCKDFLKAHDGISGFNIFGQTSYAHQYIANTYPEDIIFDSSLLKILNLDIELLVSESGVFPDPKLANDEVVLITIYDKNLSKYTVFGSRPYTGENQSDYTLCKNEEDLLRKFAVYWQCQSPDIITGYNIEFFDIPYIINRMKQITGDSYKKLSPWGIISEKNSHDNFGNDVQSYNMLGVSVLDYFLLYKKYTYKVLESYRLDFVAQTELGAKKLEHSYGTNFREYCTGVYDVHEIDEKSSDIDKMGYRRTQLKDSLDAESIAEYKELDAHLRQAAWNQYVLYNRIDVELVDQLDDKLKLIELHLTMSYTSKLNYNEAFSPVKLWDNIIYNDLLKKNIVIPNKESHNKTKQIVGAYVKDPIAGMHQWLASFDLASLYPSLIRQYNISPETITDTCLNVNLDSLLDKEPLPETNLSITANGWTYSKEKQGFLPSLMETMYNNRVVFKQQMLAQEQIHENIKKELKERGLR